MKKTVDTQLKINQLVVTFNQSEFFEKYSIIAYTLKENAKKTPSYSIFKDTYITSVCGFWINSPRVVHSPAAKGKMMFFVLIEKEKENEIVDLLKSVDTIRCQYPFDFNTLSTTDRERAIAQLAINALGERNFNKAFTYDEHLYLYGYSKPKSLEQKALEIYVNESLNIIATTKTFKKFDEKYDKNDLGILPVYALSEQAFTRKVFKPVKDYYSAKEMFDNLYILKKIPNNNKPNSIPHIYLNADNVHNGKIPTLHRVLETVNRKFEGMVNLDFKEIDVQYSKTPGTKAPTERIIEHYLQSRTIAFFDPFHIDASRRFIEEIKKEILTNGIFVKEGENLNYIEDPEKADMVIALCDKQDKPNNGFYDANRYNAIQHIIFNRDGAPNKSQLQRDLMELMLKHIIHARQLPAQIATSFENWEYVYFTTAEKTKEKDHVHLYRLKIDTTTGTFLIESPDLSQPIPCLEAFMMHLNYSSTLRLPLSAKKECRAIKADGNIYIISDSPDIAILPVDRISQFLEQYENRKSMPSQIKNNGPARELLVGFVNRTEWTEEAPLISNYPVHCYINGKDNGHMLYSNKEDRAPIKFPHARKIYVLRAANPDLIRDHIAKITGMLNLGFARWNEDMTYPLPFKLLQELHLKQSKSLR